MCVFIYIDVMDAYYSINIYTTYLVYTRVMVTGFLEEVMGESFWPRRVGDRNLRLWRNWYWRARGKKK